MTTSEEAYNYLFKKWAEKPPRTLRLLKYQNWMGDCFSKPFDNSETAKFQGKKFISWSCSNDCRLIMSNKTGTCVGVIHSVRCNNEFTDWSI